MQEKEALMHCNPTRRTFLKGTAATAALAAVGTCSVAAWRAEQAEAAARREALQKKYQLAREGYVQRVFDIVTGKRDE